MKNMRLTASDLNGLFNVSFLVNNEDDSNGNKQFVIHEPLSFLIPNSLTLNKGILNSLKDYSNRADMIIYGSSILLASIQELIDRRVSEGLEIKIVTPENVYSEFSHGVVSSQALKDFIGHARKNWDLKPKFLLILGDGTFDPIDHNVEGLAPNFRSALEKSTLPAPMIAGRFIDFSADNFFVSTEESHLPTLAIGRLPTNDPNKILSYVNKVLKYEERMPSQDENIKRISFFADEERGNYERFNMHSQNMMSNAIGFTNTLYDRVIIGSKSLTKEKIISEFQAAPFLISLMGHGAFDRFGDGLLNVNDAKNLSNTNFPIVTNWNCESAYYYDANSSYKSLGEELIFNPNGGAVAYVGSTTQTTPPAQAKLAQNFFSQLSAIIGSQNSDTRLGEILYLAKLGVGDGLYEKDIINSFSLIGDPSLKLPDGFFSNRIENLAISTEEKKSGFFGCDANANDGLTKDQSWYSGLVEFVFYILLILLGIRLVRSRRYN
jgi:hypothetical protein